MNIEEMREVCLSVKGATESFPFGDDVLVYKVMGKMFAYISLEPFEEGFGLCLKCNPEKAIELRERYTSVIPGYHSNKRHWNTIFLEGDMPDKEIAAWVSHSAEEVIKKLPKKQQEEYNNANEE